MSLRRMRNGWSHQLRPVQLYNVVFAPPPHLRSRARDPRFANTLSSRNLSSSNKQSPPMITTIEPIDALLATVNLFKKGLSRLKVDFLNSLHIQEAELTRQNLQRRVRRDYERRRQRLRSHKSHGIHIVNTSGREVTFLPSTSYAHPKRKHNNSSSSSSSSLDHSNNNDNEQSQSTTATADSIHPPYYHSSNYLLTRRPQQHLRQITRDLQITLPTVAAFLFIPFVGYSFLLLGMMFPRLLLSRQFHTREQRWEFATKEYGERRDLWWGRLNDDFWGCCMRSMPGLVFCREDYDDEGTSLSGEEDRNLDRENDNIPPFFEPFSYLSMDAAGPIFSKQSMLRFYHLFQHISQSSGASTPSESSPSIKTLQATHLHSLALSNNLAAPMLLPSNVSPLFLQTCLPSIYLQQKLTTLAEDIIIDDAALIEEGQLDDGCRGMTEEEVLDACWLRGLPTGRFADKNLVDHSSSRGVESEVHNMRIGLTHHLQMMECVMTQQSPSLQFSDSTGAPKPTESSLRSKGSLVRDNTLQLLILHLPAIRYSAMMHSKDIAG